MRGDRRINNSKTLRYDPTSKKSESIKWRQVKMGDILELHADDMFPADMVLIHAEDKSGSATEMVFIDTKNLDGETNLKPRTILDASVTSQADIAKMRGKIDYDSPNKNLVKWRGELKSKTNSSGSVDNLLL